MKPFKLRVTAPEKTIKLDNAAQVSMRTTMGEIGILANHENYMAVLTPGIVRIKTDDGKFALAAILRGTVKVSRQKTTIIAVSLIHWMDDIEQSELERELEAARLALKEKTGSLR